MTNTDMYSYPTIEEPQLADQDWFPTQSFFTYPVPYVADHTVSTSNLTLGINTIPPQLRPSPMVRSSSFSPTVEQLSRYDHHDELPRLPIGGGAPTHKLTATPMKRSFTQPDAELRRSQSLVAMSISNDGRARLQPHHQQRDHSPHKYRIEEDADCCNSDAVFSDRSSLSSASSASPQLVPDFPVCVPVATRSKSCVSLSHGAPALPPPATYYSPYSSPSPSASSSDEEEETPKNDACVALARLVARKRSKSLIHPPSRPPHVRSKSLANFHDSHYEQHSPFGSKSTMESFQSRARRACAPSVLTPPASAVSDHGGFDFTCRDIRDSQNYAPAPVPVRSMRSISPKRGRTSMAVAFNYTDDSNVPSHTQSHLHRRQMSLSDLGQLSLQPNWSN